MPATQDHREISVSSPLGKDVLLLAHMQGSERFSQPSTYHLSLLSERADIKADALLGKIMTVAVHQPQGGQRYFNGFVTRFAFTGQQDRYYTYQATLHPWTWFLTRSADCKIFQDKSVVDIIKLVFDDYSVADFDASNLSGQYTPLSYCVQYRETDFAFISRLMESVGIYYYFKCGQSRHTMVLADSYSAHEDIAGYSKIGYAAANTAALAHSEVIYSWSVGGEIQPGCYALKAFDFEKPAATSSGSLLVKSSITRKHDQSTYEMFDYPGIFLERAQGETVARMRIEGFHAQYEQAQGGSNARGVCPGGLFTLNAHPRADQNQQWLVIAADYVLTSDAYQSTPSNQPVQPFVCQFVALGKEHVYRPSCSTPKPVVQGPQTALVVGKSGEEIWTDKYGRIKVQFHWDRVRPDDETSSCWIRVAQGWAGKHWGTIFIPRVGQEVVVSFLEGDPDQPLVTGSVYNAESMPPYALPEKATRSTLKSNSSKGGGGYNEIRLEDKKGNEQLFLYAEKNQDNRVKNDWLTWIGNDQHLVVGKGYFEKIGGDKNSQVTGAHNEKIGGKASLDVGSDLEQKAGTKFGVAAGTDIHIKAGMNVVIEAGASITLKAGGGFIVIGPTSVAVSGTPIMLNSGGSAGSGAGVSPTAPQAPKDADEGKD